MAWEMTPDGLRMRWTPSRVETPRAIVEIDADGQDQHPALAA